MIETINYDGDIAIATGRSRKETHWKNKELTWSALVKKLSDNHRTAETFAEYAAAKKTRRDEIKDIGGFVGGHLVGGRRKAGAVSARSLITLDADYATDELWSDFCLLFNCAAVLYSTHSHSPQSPRYRLIIPTSRELSTDEYEPVARKVAALTGIEYFDSTTYQPERLMYWPSSSKDGEAVFRMQDGPFLDVDEILAGYRNWRDCSEWPVSNRQHELIRREMKKQQDPMEKPGVVGAFCRTFSIPEVIDRYLSDDYEACDIPNRYTYRHGSTAAGMVVYDDKFAFSHHGTDPSGGKLCNAFDLVRLHKYGLLDEDSDAIGINKPSYKEMMKLAMNDEVVRALLITEKTGQAVSDFEDIALENDEWIRKLKIDKRGNILNGLDNVVTILENDSQIKGRIAFDDFDGREVALGHLPWRSSGDTSRYLKDTDVSNLKHFLKVKYDLNTTTVFIEDGLNVIYEVNKINSVKDYLKPLKWDGTPRIDTLFIDYMGAEDTEYTRAVSRKMLVAAVARVFQPGIKFDYMLTLVGRQGIGKSTLIAKLGMQWFSDSFDFRMIENGNKAYEALQGAWLIEAGELKGLRKAEVNSAKNFLASREDRFRVSYGRRISYFPRKCVFFGTTNDLIFLKDISGNRRWWVVMTYVTEPAKDVFKDLTQGEIDQIWAEARTVYEAGKEMLALPKHLEEVANNIREAHTEADDRAGMVQEYLEMLLPENWADMSVPERRIYLRSQNDPLRMPGRLSRESVCAAEIWCELFGNEPGQMTQNNTKFIHDIMTNMEGWKREKWKVTIPPYGKQRAYRKEGETVPF